MEFQLSYFKSWKMMLWKCCTQYAIKFGKLSSGHRTGKGQFSFQSQRKAMPKNAQVKWSGSVEPESLRPHGLLPTRLLRPWGSPGKNTGMGYHFLLQGIFPTQGLNPVSCIGGRHFDLWATRHVRWVQLCSSSLNILWHFLSLGLEWKLTFSSPVDTDEFSKFAGILSTAF